MTHYQRYAIYYTAPGSALAQRGAAWLGWDIATGRPEPQPSGLDTVTRAPYKYGFHGTLKPPFALAEGYGAEELARDASDLARGFKPFEVPSLRVSRLGSFLALKTEDTDDLRRLAAECVTALDRFRAPPSEAELARRRARPLSPAQDALLEQWGYPFVLEEFRFHMTLTGPIQATDVPDIGARADAHFSLDRTSQVVDAITLCGERPDGRFEAIKALKLG